MIRQQLIASELLKVKQKPQTEMSFTTSLDKKGNIA